MLAANSGTEVGVVCDGELDVNDNAPVVVKTVQVGAKRAAGVIVVVGRRGSGIGTIIRALLCQAAADVRRFRPPLLLRKTAGFLAGQGAAEQCLSTLCSVSVSDSTDDIVPLFDLAVGRCGFGVGVLIFF